MKLWTLNLVSLNFNTVLFVFDKKLLTTFHIVSKTCWCCFKIANPNSRPVCMEIPDSGIHWIILSFPKGQQFFPPESGRSLLARCLANLASELNFEKPQGGRSCASIANQKNHQRTYPNGSVKKKRVFFWKGVRRSNKKPIEKAWGWPSTGFNGKFLNFAPLLDSLESSEVHFNQPFGGLRFLRQAIRWSILWGGCGWKSPNLLPLFVGHHPKVVSACERAEQWAWALAIVDQLWKKAFDFMEDIYMLVKWNMKPKRGGLIDDFLFSGVSWLQGVCLEGGVSVGSFGKHCPGSKGQDGACGSASFCPKDLDCPKEHEYRTEYNHIYIEFAYNIEWSFDHFW